MRRNILKHASVEAGGTAVADLNDVATAAPAIVQTAIDAYGQLDIVVNNAGINPRRPVR